MLLDVGEPTGPAIGIRAGWVRTQVGPWSKTGARWHHTSGWRLEHCGHPTANYPWALYDPEGRMVRRGVTLDTPDPTIGTAWPSLNDAMVFVAEVLAGTRAFSWPEGS